MCICYAIKYSMFVAVEKKNMVKMQCLEYKINMFKAAEIKNFGCLLFLWNDTQDINKLG